MREKLPQIFVHRKNSRKKTCNLEENKQKIFCASNSAEKVPFIAKKVAFIGKIKLFVNIEWEFYKATTIMMAMKRKF